MQMLRRQRRLVACLALIALMGGMAASIFAPLKSKQIVDDVLGAMVICTSHGAQLLTPDGDSSPSTPSSEHCWMCTLLGALQAAVLVLILAFVLVPLPAIKLTSVCNRRLADHLCLGGIHSRAPPQAA